MEGARKKKKKKKRKGDAIEEERKALKKKRIKYNILHQLYFSWASLVAQTVKNLPAVQETLGSIPGSGESLGEENDYPLQYSYLENFMDRGAWQATVHGVIESQIQLSF